MLHQRRCAGQPLYATTALNGSVTVQLNGVQGIAIDGSDNVWLLDIATSANGGNTITELAPAGTGLLDTNGITNTDVGPHFLGGIAVTDAGYYWYDRDHSSMRIAQSGVGGGSTHVTAGSTPVGIALDASSNGWVANSGNSTVVKYSEQYTSASTSLSTQPA